MRTFDIAPPDEAIRPALQSKIDNLAKPRGSLGRLEELALRVGLIQQSLAPTLRAPHNILFAADHGILSEGVSPTPREVTWQQTLNFVGEASGTGIGFLCRQHGFRLVVVDAGVDYDFPAGCGVIDRKIRRGTSNCVQGPAMSRAELELCIEAGAAVVDMVAATGCNVVSFGEMGAGNTSPSALWMHWFTGLPLCDCTGAGSGLDDAGIRHKLEVLSRASDFFAHDPLRNGGCASKKDGFSEPDPLEIMARFGGFEMAMAVGGMLRAAERRMTILVDGFIMTACILAASRLHPAVTDYAIFAHEGDESGHRLLLQTMGVRPILSLGLRLGEGSGAVCAWPIVESAVRMIGEMNTFTSSQVTKYF
jgi:nicotinate-nucleotide--dimethylbenzimidazole phosphoribosyltransferase